MGISTVTILVQSAIILVLAGAAVYFRTKWVDQKDWTQSLRENVGELRKSNLDLTYQLNLANGRPLGLSDLRPNIPAKPKQEPIIHAKSPAQVRQLTEQQWGIKPGDREDA